MVARTWSAKTTNRNGEQLHHLIQSTGPSAAVSARIYGTGRLFARPNKRRANILPFFFKTTDNGTTVVCTVTGWEVLPILPIQRSPTRKNRNGRRDIRGIFDGRAPEGARLPYSKGNETAGHPSGHATSCQRAVDFNAQE